MQPNQALAACSTIHSESEDTPDLPVLQTAKLCTTRGASSVHIAPADCCTMTQIDQLSQTVLKEFGPVDILVCLQSLNDAVSAYLITPGALCDIRGECWCRKCGAGALHHIRRNMEDGLISITGHVMHIRNQITV